MLFVGAQHLPGNVQPHWVSAGSEAILALAKESLELRDQLGLSVDGAPGQLYVLACRESADTNNDNRRGPKKLASWLLGELGFVNEEGKQISSIAELRSCKA